jgi:FkbM family methyltransferase
VWRRLNKPQYVFRPGQVLRRLAVRSQARGTDETVLLPLPGGAHIECWPSDAIGSSIARTGIYDLVATEALMRLADSGDLTVDAGANVGHMTRALAVAAGPGGRVVGFEPHPEVFAVLARNVERWRRHPASAAIEVRRCGLSRRGGRATLVTPAGFAENRGTGRVVGDEPAEGGVEIAVARLDEAVAAPVGVLKLDVEGHELAVLDGAAGLLAAAAVRDIVFEELKPYPTALTRRLEDCGFHVRELVQDLRGPRLVAPGSRDERGSWDPPVLIASGDPERLHRRFASRGWRALRGHRAERRARRSRGRRNRAGRG